METESAAATPRAPVSTRDATGQQQQSVIASAQVVVSACHRTLEIHLDSSIIDDLISCQMPDTLYYGLRPCLD